jgi:hypothetical protein
MDAKRSLNLMLPKGGGAGGLSLSASADNPGELT